MKNKPVFKRLTEAPEKKRKNSENILKVGETIRGLRKAKRLSGVDLCRRSGKLDPRTLTAIEKGRIKNPSIESFQALARGLDMPISEIFRRAEEGGSLPYEPGSQKGMFQLEFPAAGIKIVSFTPLVKDLFCGKIMIGGRKKITHSLFKHPFPTFVAAMIGRIEIRFEGKTFLLKEGDNLFFNGILRHSFYNPSEKESVLMFVTAPSFL